ncbi:DUF1858 domain-containing protein [Candidatus Woesearchaeota archaeon]|nr:DUF1858 domain-containing protein [Candidatus Woesearchaeota archaeon]
MTEKITKDMPIGEVVNKYPETIGVFMEHGLHCIGCAAAHFENIEQGCEAHGIDADKLIEDLNKVIEKKK